MMGDQIPFTIPVTLYEANLSESSLPILRRIRPDWFDSTTAGDGRGEPGDESKVKMKMFSGGLTNCLVGLFMETDVEDIVIFKLYGDKTDLFIDREQEVQTMQMLSKRRCGPTLYAIFQNGIAYEYFPGTILNVENCRSSKIYPLVAKEMAKQHSIPLTGNLEAGASIWKMLRKFNKSSLETIALDPVLKGKLEDMGLSTTWAFSAIEEMENFCSKEKMPVVFCHNDVLLANIIYDESKSKVSFIDFEYGAPNYAPFDIANHFNEFAGVDDADFSRVPDQEFQRAWIIEYLSHYLSNNSDEIFNVDVFLYWVQLCAPLSHLLWTLWSIMQASYSKIDFDYVHYIFLRFTEYNKCVAYLRRQNSKPS